MESILLVCLSHGSSFYISLLTFVQQWRLRKVFQRRLKWEPKIIGNVQQLLVLKFSLCYYAVGDKCMSNLDHLLIRSRISGAVRRQGESKILPLVRCSPLSHYTVTSLMGWPVKRYFAWPISPLWNRKTYFRHQQYHLFNLVYPMLSTNLLKKFKLVYFVTTFKESVLFSDLYIHREHQRYPT